MAVNISNLPTIFRKDYTPPEFLVEEVDIIFNLDKTATRITTHITMHRGLANAKEIVLFGKELKLLQLRLNGEELRADQYLLKAAGQLIIPSASDKVFLEIETLVNPEENTSLTGLYISKGNFFTQCEAEGFRKITYFPDRPDVMGKYTVMIRANKHQYPVLLSNGNLIEEGNLAEGYHYAKWEDPFKKPSYLFALVAGRLVCQEHKHRLKSGRTVLLQIWVESSNLTKTQHAMDALINSISWDEKRFGLELDLDRFMIVAADDFNTGAMENKGLNIFNTKYILANPKTATDIDYANIEAVVGHEYFHNWTGNRVTCRDWFQLSLKEGLTVFREQEFSADMANNKAGHVVKRIDDVCFLRQRQFPEDAGPMSHSVRPDSYVEINNFYTVTIYEKGAEIVRMYQNLLGSDGFRKGMDLYFNRHDGQAVGCDDFRFAMMDANKKDLNQFELWYSQAGTPRVRAQGKYNARKRKYTLTLLQTCSPTPGQEKKLPFHIPILVGLLDKAGKDIPLYLQTDHNNLTNGISTCMLELTKEKQNFCFVNVNEKPIPSILRNFSAPIILDVEYSDAELEFLFTYDNDPFNRWEAGQRLATRILLDTISKWKSIHPDKSQDMLGAMSFNTDILIRSFELILREKNLDPSFRERLLTLPSEASLSKHNKTIDPYFVHQSTQFLYKKIGHTLKGAFLETYHCNKTLGNYSPDAESAGKRALKNLSLFYLMKSDTDSAHMLAQKQYNEANNMTDRMAALICLTNSSAPGKNKALEKFYKDFENEDLVIDKWFALQAMSHTTNISAIRSLSGHPAFTLKNPNRARSLVLNFCNYNPTNFHAEDGSGYQFWEEKVLILNRTNPQMAACLTRSMEHWRKYPSRFRKKMYASLNRVALAPNLSKDILEVVTKILAN